MVSQRELNRLNKIISRKYWSGFVYGAAMVGALTAGALHSVAEPEIARATFQYSSEVRALHSTLLMMRNISAGIFVIGLISGFFLEQSVDDIAA